MFQSGSWIFPGALKYIYMQDRKLYKICFFVPESHLEKVKNALFNGGAGKIGNYDSCCWQTKGEGQFRALDGSKPFTGTQGEVEKRSEYKVEMVCEDNLVHDLVRILRKKHPYEEPAFDVWQIEEFR